MNKLVLATENPGKIREFSDLFADFAFDIIPQSSYATPAIAETGLSFVENAILKARHAAQHTGLPAIGDDSGLEVDAIDGAPGIYSARYAGANASDYANVEKLLNELRNIPQPARSARFQCVLVYMRHGADPTPLICQGTWEGAIALVPQGDRGFGYDPVFFVPEEGKTAAELTPDIKNRLSHRGRALGQLVRALCKQYRQTPIQQTPIQ